MRKILGPLLEYNLTSRRDLFETLRVYILSNGNWTKTKDTLLIHGNTLSYRLNRLMEILNIDFQNYYRAVKKYSLHWKSLI